MLLNRYEWLVTFIPLIVGAIYFKKFDRGLIFFYLFVVLAVLTELTTKIGIHIIGIKNTMPIGHIYIAGACLLTGLFFSVQLKGFVKKKIIVGIIIFFEAFAIFNMFFIQNLYEFPSISGATGAIMLVTFSILLFTKIMIEGKIKNLVAEPVIWLNSAVLIYYSSNFFFYILYNIILGFSREFSLRTISIFNFINAIFYVLITISFLKAGKKQSDKISTPS
jgi:hypothetical protein